MTLEVIFCPEGVTQKTSFGRLPMSCGQCNVANDPTNTETVGSLSPTYARQPIEPAYGFQVSLRQTRTATMLAYILCSSCYINKLQLIDILSRLIFLKQTIGLSMNWVFMSSCKSSFLSICLCFLYFNSVVLFYFLYVCFIIYMSLLAMANNIIITIIEQ